MDLSFEHNLDPPIHLTMLFGRVVVAGEGEAVGVADGFDQDAATTGADTLRVQFAFDLFREPDRTGGGQLPVGGELRGGDRHTVRVALDADALDDDVFSL